MDNQQVRMNLPSANGTTIDLIYEDGYWKLVSDQGAGQMLKTKRDADYLKKENDELRQKLDKCMRHASYLTLDNQKLLTMVKSKQ
ncbi:hypothetical protein SS50377_26692 [Spironucleus salmonicida]|uniref:Uncharacterized protein n=1 Tax=Spironucleus salmonicida TaxID=348837 RepID=V6LZK4_9EUKA|nr:hypothetical protein SS50377_26692 [Spironucleus salmonicida]|eukprot:EST49166.1 Hypothetical protein SS50377_10379 [Spironucleus salmonicida]